MSSSFGIALRRMPPPKFPDNFYTLSRKPVALHGKGVPAEHVNFDIFVPVEIGGKKILLPGLLFDSAASVPVNKGYHRNNFELVG